MEVQPLENVALIVLVGTICFSLALSTLFLFIHLHQKRMRDKENELLQMENNNRLRLIRSIMEAEEKQRESISKNLHDDIGTAVSLLKINIGIVFAESKVEQKERFNSINNDIDNIMWEIRAICRELLPIELKLLGLDKALEQFCKIVSVKTGLVIHYKSNYDGKFHQPFEQVIIYRLFKEILNNIIKYSFASTAYITIKVNERKFRLLFKYNGKGISNSEIESIKKTSCSIGLNSIDSRLIVLNGSIDYIVDRDNNNNRIIILQSLMENN